MPASGLSRQRAVETACESLGLEFVEQLDITARPMQLSDESMPFLRDQLARKSTWRIEFSDIDLAEATGRPSLANQYIRHLVVVLAPDTGHVLSITSTWPHSVARISPYPSLQEEEQQLRARDIRYSGLPAKEPRVTLFEALDSDDVIFWSKHVKQIHACYVVESTIKYENRHVWVIQLRGFPPFVPPVPPGADPASIPANQRNHIRNVVDAQTGEWLGAGTAPQPVEHDDLVPLEQRFEAPRITK